MGITPHNRISTKHKNVGVVTLGVEEQFSINEKGERYVKIRVTHDCSFPGPSGLSVNNRVQRESLQPCFYGFCLLRILYMISAMQSRWPTKRILIGKTDLDAAYRQIHAHANIASTCIVIVDEPEFLCLRLPFGTTPAPAEYTTISEAEIDLGNDLLQDRSWKKMILTRHTDPYSQRRRNISQQAIWQKQTP